MTASVVVPTRNKADRLRLTLRGLGRGASRPHEVIVVDDGCTDTTGEVLAEAAATGLPIRVVTGPQRGRAAARNAGAAAATGRLLVFLDDDILVGPQFVAAHEKAHEDGYGSRIGAGASGQPAVVHGPLRELPMAARLVAAAPPDPYRSATDRTFGRTVVNALERLILAMAERSAPPVAPWLVCVGANVSLPASRWHADGGFDENFGTTWGCEDLEYGYRLCAAGAAMVVAPDADGVHLTHVRADRWEQHTVNLRRFVALHPDPAVAALTSLLAPDGSPARYLQAAQTTPPDPESV
ncbi:glycosyltransferase family 2 protein [Plantactinospora sp. CA-290183]|uniref:glycosyltransferase family 2 protein n=1 Tax=Plantactinospora sp. CA-290183 TaxID=3240006 RepID=UPI003D8E9435